MVPKQMPYRITYFHCLKFNLSKFGLKAINKIIADKPILKDAVAAAPICGKSPFAIAAPHCTLIIESKTAGIGGIFNLLFIWGLVIEAQNYGIITFQIFLNKKRRIRLFQFSFSDVSIGY
ncbi:hypothetical protein D3C73_934980 [compost metagenome]